MSADDAHGDGDRARPKHDGSRGASFRSYKRDFLTTSRGKFAKDDRYAFHKAYLRIDEGGTGPGAPAMPAAAGGAGGGANPAHTAATMKRQVRHGLAFNYLYESITDENLKQMLADLADTNPAELAGDAWDLIVRECDEPHDDLELAKLNLEWSGMSIMNTVGYSESTMSDFARELNNANGRRPHAQIYNENAKAIKFLSAINYPESLAKDAAKELKAVGARREFNRGAPNYNRNYNDIVRNFDDLWRALFQTGAINAKAAQRGQRHETALLHYGEDALMHTGGMDEYFDNDETCYIVDLEDGDTIFYVGRRNNFSRRPGGQGGPNLFDSNAFAATAGGSITQKVSAHRRNRNVTSASAWKCTSAFTARSGPALLRETRRRRLRLPPAHPLLVLLPAAALLFVRAVCRGGRSTCTRPLMTKSKSKATMMCMSYLTT